MEKFGYIYLTTNNISGKIYIGQKKSKKFVKSYKGSGKYILNALNKYGWDNFSCEIIEWCYSQQELNDRERYWISHYRQLNISMYNIADGAHGGDIYHTLSDEGKERFKEKLRNNSCFVTESAEVRKARIQKSVETRRLNNIKRRELYDGYTVPPEVRQKMSDIQKATPRTYRPTPEQIRKGHEKLIGQKRTPQQKENISKGVKKAYENNPSLKEKSRQHMLEYQKEHGNPFLGKKHTEETKRVIKKKAKIITHNLIWVNNGVTQTRIFKEDMEYYMEQGYHPGRLPNKKKRKPATEETRKKQSLAKLGKKRPDLHRHLTEEEKRKMKEGVISRMTDTIRVSKDGVTKHIRRTELQTYVNLGYSIPKSLIQMSMGDDIIWISKSQLYTYLLKGYRIKYNPNVSQGYQYRVCVNDGVKNKFIHQDNLNYFLENGYFIGGIEK